MRAILNILGIAIVLAAVTVGFKELVGVALTPEDVGKAVTIVVVCVCMLLLPAWGVFCLLRHGTTTLHRNYVAGRTEGMTEAEKTAYLNQPPFIVRHYGIVGFIAVCLLAIMVPYLSLPVLGLWLARMWHGSRVIREELSGERPAVRTEGPDLFKHHSR